MEGGDVCDDISQGWMQIISQSSRRSKVSHWIANDAGLGIEYEIVTNTGDRLIWSS